MKKTVEQYFKNTDPKWISILHVLRRLCLETEMEETIKWGIPVYTIQNKNVVGIGAFKSYAGLWFFNGSFLKDKEGVLVNAQEGKTKGMRHWRFQQDEVVPEEKVKAYILEAIENQKQGKEIKIEKKKEYSIPKIFESALQNDPVLKEQFDRLTPGRQRTYLEYLTEPKLEKTVISRLEKCIPLILEGKGLNDKYQK